jgi:hypothetical protein
MKALLLSALLLIGSLGFAQYAAAQQGIIREVVGKVEIKAPGGDWVAAEPGQRIENATVISTGFKGTARIGLGNSILTVAPLTRLTLQEIREAQQGGGERVALELQTGRVRADVKPPAGGRTDFTVRSPSATASVRGTVFEFDGKELSVDEGRVRLAGGDGTGVNVSAGHSVATDPATGKTPSVAETVTAALAPPAPAGVVNGAAPSAAAPPGNGDIEVGTVWD